MITRRTALGIPAMILAKQLCASESTVEPRFRLREGTSEFALIHPEGRPFWVLGVNHIGDTTASTETIPTPREIARINAAENLAAWGYNTAGDGAHGTIQQCMPYFVSVPLVNNGHFRPQYEFRFSDVFSPAFDERIERKIRSTCEQHFGNPNLIGFYWTDTPRWNLDVTRKQRGTDWVSYIRRLPPGSAGKIAYIDFLRHRFGQSIGHVNDAFRMRAESFSSLSESDFSGLELDRPQVRAADEAFLAVIADCMYSKARTIFKRLDPAALLFGEKFKAHDHTDAVLKTAAKYVDVISIQPGPETGPQPGQGRHEAFFDEGYFDAIHKLTGKPIMICDHAVSWWTESRPVTLWFQHASPREAVVSYSDYLQAVASKPYIVGYCRCQYLSEFRADRGLLKQGLLDEHGQPYKEIVDGFAMVNRDVLKRRL